MNIAKNAGQPFTAQDDQAIREMHAACANAKEIAARLERTEPGINARLERLGLRKGNTMAKQSALVG
jgi:hypothetical protein